MDNRPLLSIHVSVFNLEKYIETCLDSILSQSFKSYELILIDNGSTDGSIAICEEYAKKYDQIKYVKLSLPTVIGRPFAYAMNHYEGQYFMSVDGDDYLKEGALENIAKAIYQSYPDLIMGSFVCDIEEGMTNFKDADIDATRINGVPYRKALKYLTTLPNFHTFQWRFIVNREVIKNKEKKMLVKKNEIYSRYNDGITVTGYLISSNSIIYIEDPFYVYRRRGNSLSSEEVRGVHAVEFFKAFVAIAQMFENEIDKTLSHKKFYIYNMLDSKFELFRILFLDTSEASYPILRETIDKNIKIFKKLRPVSENYRQFYDCITKNKKDIMKGLREYYFIEYKLLMKSIEGCRGKKTYVFPTGMCGENICNILKANGTEVIGFLDNDKMKENKEFSGIICKTPDTLNKDEDIKNRCVFISTAYRGNIPIMTNQIIGHGISDHDIFIR